MWVFASLVISLVAATAVHARPQDAPADQSTTPATTDADPPAPTDSSSDPVDTSAPIIDNLPGLNLPSFNLPGFCPSDITQDLDTLGHGNGNGDCRCGQYSDVLVSDAETDAAQPLAAAPDWSLGGGGKGSCGCMWGQNQCGCYNGGKDGDGWLYGNYGGEGGDNRCTVTVTAPGPQPTNPGQCGNGDRYCTVTVTVSQPGQPQPPVTVPGPGPTVTVPGRPEPTTVTVPGPGKPEPTTVTVGVPPPVTSVPSETRSTKTTATVPGFPTSETGRTTLTTGGQGSQTRSTTTSTSSRTTSSTFVTVNAAPIQTGVMAFGAMFGGAAILANL